MERLQQVHKRMETDNDGRNVKNQALQKHLQITLLKIQITNARQQNCVSYISRPLSKNIMLYTGNCELLTSQLSSSYSFLRVISLS